MAAKGVVGAVAALAVVLGACGHGSPAADLSSPGRGTPAPSASATPGPPVAATTPEGLADQLADAETAIRNPATPAAALPRLGHTEQVAYRALVVHADWQPDVLARLPTALRAAAEANVAAGTDLRVLSSSESHELPHWYIVAPPPPDDLLAEYKAAEASLGVPWQYLAAIHLVETRMGRIRGDSSAGAQGPMQFVPATWDAYGAGGDINSFHDAILGAARLLRANGAPADMANALYHYNPSDRYVRAVTAYAEQMRADERTYLGYYYWQVYYFDTWLPEGWAG